jgi:hypothetical protein
MSPAIEPPSARRTTVSCLALAAAVAACYANTLGVPFVFDDELLIALNPGIDSWRLSSIEAPQRLVAFLSFKLDDLLWGLSPTGFHVTNAIIHTGAAAAVFLLARALLLRAGEGRLDERSAGSAALAAALLWAVHPLQTQAVTYVVQRMTSLAAALYVAALAAYAVARGRGPGVGRWALYGAALVSAVLAMLTKEIAFTLPVAIVVLELAFFDATPGRRAAWLAPFVALLPIVPGVRLLQSGAGALGSIEDATRMSSGLSRLDYLATETRVVLGYLRLLLVPVGQNVDHDFPIEHGFGAPAVLGASAALLALLAAGICLLRRRATPGGRVAGFGIVLFFLALSVESSVIPIVDVSFEHRVYLPSVGLALALAGLVAELLSRRPSAARAVWVTVLAAATIFGALTVARNQVWRDPLTLWQDAAQKSPNKARPHYALGNALRERGDLAGAEREWRRSAELAPTDSPTRNQLALVALSRGDLAGAEAHLRRGLDGRPVLPDVYYNLALVLEREGRLAESVDLYRLFVEKASSDRAAEAAQVRARFGWPPR